MMGEIKVGVIGNGYWGPNLIRNFVEIPQSEVVIVSDLNEDRLATINAKYPRVKVTTNYKELFDQDLDAVVIATPPITHYPLAKEVLERGYHVLVEKPFTTKAEHAEELIEIAAAQKLVLMVGHTYEYNNAVHAMKRVIESGELGQIYYVDTARLSLGLFQPNMNVLWDLAPHDISILMYLLGNRPVSVCAHGAPCVFEGIHDVVYVDMQFPENILAHIHVSWLDPKKVRRTTVVGSKKMLVYNDVEATEKIKIYDIGIDKLPYTDTFADFHFSYRYGDVIIPNIRFTEPLRVECQHFLDCIENHCEPQSGGKNGLAVVKVLEAAQNSLNRNGANQERISW